MLVPFQIGSDGWLADAVQLPSPNFDHRAEGTEIALLVIHNISLPPGRFGGPFIADLFLNRLDYEADPYFDQLRALRVSSHFLIRRDGMIVQFVSVNDRAWHAGVSSFRGRQKCNDFSVGIELEGTDCDPFEDVQYAALAALTVALQARYPIRDVTGHQHIAPGRKTDPGPLFDWSTYRLRYQKIRPQVAATDTNNTDLIFRVE